jgi:hypothetical protein
LITYLQTSDAESEAKVEGSSPESWGEIAEFLGQTPSVAQRWQNEGMPVNREGRFVYGSPASLTAWVGTEHGQKEPIHIASESEDLLGDLKQGLSYVRRQRKGLR